MAGRHTMPTPTRPPQPIQWSMNNQRGFNPMKTESPRSKKMIKNFIRVLFTPSVWIRNDPTDKTVDAFFRVLLDNLDEVKLISCSHYTIRLEFRRTIYEFWIANRFYAFLSETNAYEIIDEKNMRELYRVRNKMPSRATAFAFYDAFRDVIQQYEDMNYAGLKSMAEVVNEEKKHAAKD
jgi:hypothetical protein